MTNGPQVAKGPRMGILGLELQRQSWVPVERASAPAFSESRG
jgi:hypothetical protein